MSQAQYPFHFDCHRCGNCCRVGHGHVWVEEDDLEQMAAAKQMTSEAFVERFVYAKDGRLSLREEENGACSLLDGSNRCSIYESRPAQCRTFPYWPQLAREGPELDMASAYCPGIQRFPSRELALEVLPQVQDLLSSYAKYCSVDAIDVDAGERWGTSLEVDLFLSKGYELRNVSWPYSQQLRDDLEELAAVSGYPYSSSPWLRLLKDRDAGWQDLGGVP